MDINEEDDDISEEEFTNPFQNEFDKKDVSNKMDETIINKAKLKDVDVNSILNYNEELRKKKQFGDPFNEESQEQIDDDLDRAKYLFQDFLAMPKISGKLEGFSDTFRIPKDIITETGEKTIINDDPKLNEYHQKQSTVLVNRNENDEIISIELYCSCGEKTLLKFEYGE